MNSSAQGIKTKIKALTLKWLASKQQSPWDPEKVYSVLVMRYDRIGDMVVTTPLLKAIKKLYPAIILDVLASPANSVVLESNDDITSVKIYPRSLVGKFCTLFALRGRYELVIDLNHSLIWQAILELRLLSPRWVISPQKGNRYGLNPRALSLYDRMANKDLDSPISLIYLDLIRLLKTPKNLTFAADYYVPFSDLKVRNALSALSEYRPPFYGINMSGGRDSMCFKKSDFQYLVETLLGSEPTGTVLVFSTPNRYAEMRELTGALSQFRQRIYVLQPSNNVMDAAAILRHLRILVTPDTSLVHFACAEKIPFVAVYAKEQALYRHWQPITNAAFRVCFSDDTKSLRGYSITEVIKSIKQILRETKA
jgi:ADP-heptose:LPS heptosyltransferase